VTATVFVTTTVTSSGGETATKVVYDTTTVFATPTDSPAAQKRAGEIAPRTGVAAAPTGAPDADYLARSLALRDLEARAIFTEVVTVTVGGGGGSTVVETTTRTVKNTATSRTTITSTVTTTDQVGASTTITSTSHLTVTSTVVTTGVEETTTLPPQASDSGTGVPDSNGSHSSSSGLSTGAKAGIGVGVGVGGLLILGALLFLILRRRNRGPRPEHDDLVGASEVPVGGAGGGGGSGLNGGSSGSQPPMSSHTPSAAAFLAPGRAPVAREGYRGTALGDGRAGYAKPEPYGSAYTSPSPTTTMAQTVSPASFERANLVTPHHADAAELPNDNPNAAKWHDPNAAEIDGHAVMSHQSGPVYEMPTQNYR
jgi:hypothetical protein